MSKITQSRNDVCKVRAGHRQIHILPRCRECRRGLTMRILSVRPSVRLSKACIVTKQKKDMFRFIYHAKDHLV